MVRAPAELLPAPNPVAEPPPKTAPLLDRALNAALVRPFVARQTLSTLRRSVRRDHYPAPYAIVDLWQRYGAAGAASYEAEARSISELMCTPTSRNLVRVFLLQDRLKGLGGDSTAEFRRVHVIGAGVMGGDIAAWSAFRGMSVTLQDRTPELVQPAMDRVDLLRETLGSCCREWRLGAHNGRQGEGAHADLVIEAIFENVEAKRALHAEIEPKLRPLRAATNTSHSDRNTSLN